MVPKVAVIALVGILAVPILLGYGMNLSQVTESTYTYSDDPVNVTPLLQSATTKDAYTFVHADPYTLNSSFSAAGTRTNVPMPIYNHKSSNITSQPLSQQTIFPAGSVLNIGGTFNAWGGNIYLGFTADYDTNVSQIRVNLYTEGGVQIFQQNNIKSFYYDGIKGTFEYAYYATPTSYISGTAVTIPNSNYILELLTISGSIDNGAYLSIAGTSGTTYADLSAGYYFTGGLMKGYTVLPAYTRSVLMTVNLDSITDANYQQRLSCAGSYYTLQKTTVGSDVHWTATNSNTSEVIDLYYDPNRNDNTYQIYWDLTTTNQDNTYYYYSSHREFRYIGGWPTSFGEAPAYLTYTDDDTYNSSIGLPEQHITSIGFTYGSQRSPTYRIDDAETRGYIINTISDVTYDPAVFKNNPATTITNVSMSGTSLQFGGNTYAVSNGDITLGTHQVSVNGIKLDSVPSSNGGYDNMINGIVISNTVSPSTITFDGSWVASVITVSTESSTYQTTKWAAGEFGWNGIDQNFLIVGLLTSLGMFIALGIYIRRTKSSLWPLLIVCGGAVVLFFTML